MVERFLDAFDRERQEAVPRGQSLADLERRFYKALGSTGDPQVFFQGVQQFRQMKQNKIINYVKSAYALDAAGNREGAAQQLQAAGMLLYPNIRSQVNVGPQDSYVVRNYDAETGEMTGGYALNSNQFMELALALEDSEAFLKYGLDQYETRNRVTQQWRRTKAYERARNAEVEERRMRTQYLAAQKATEEALLEPRVQNELMQAYSREMQGRKYAQEAAGIAERRPYEALQAREEANQAAIQTREDTAEYQRERQKEQDNARNFGLRVAQRAMDEHFARVQPTLDRVTDDSFGGLEGEALETFATGVDVSLRGLGRLNTQTFTLEPDAAMMLYFENWANSMRLADPDITEDQALTAIMATLQPETKVGFVTLKDGTQALHVGTSTTAFPLAGRGQVDAREALDIVRTTLARQLGYEEPEVFKVTAAERPLQIADSVPGYALPRGAILSPRAQAQAVEYLPITQDVYEQRLADRKRREEAIDTEGRRARVASEASEARRQAEERENRRAEERAAAEAEYNARIEALNLGLGEDPREMQQQVLDRQGEGPILGARRRIRDWREDNEARRQAEGERAGALRRAEAETRANQVDTLPPDLQNELMRIATMSGRAKGQRIRELAQRYPQYRDAISRFLQDQRR